MSPQGKLRLSNHMTFNSIKLVVTLLICCSSCNWFKSSALLLREKAATLPALAYARELYVRLGVETFFELKTNSTSIETSTRELAPTNFTLT